MKIVLIEDQAMIRELLAGACRAAFAPEAIAEASSAAEARAACRRVRPDLIILDLELPDGDGLDLLPELRTYAPQAKVLALSSHVDELTVHRAWGANIDGFVDKNGQAMESLRAAVAQVMTGGQYVSPTVQAVWKSLREEPSAFTKILSDREQQVLSLIGRGYTNSEIAERLGLRAITVQNHRCNIMAKLGLHSTSHLIRFAMEKGFTRIRLPAFGATGET